MMKRRILFLTGTRADFGKMKPLIEQADQLSDFECHVFATGMHMLARYGHTYLEVGKAGFKNVFFHMNHVFSDHSQMDLVLANTIQGLGLYVREFTPSLIVVHGDRVEALAGAIVGALNNILVAHIEGGELSGTVDELVRHAVSKLSHAHFVANEEARARLVQMGEIPESIFVIGSPDIDVMLSDKLPGLSEAKSKYEIPFDEYAIFIYHPVTTESTQLQRNIDVVVDALHCSGMNYVVVYPNNDTGSQTLMDAVLPLAKDPHFRLLPSMRFEYFLVLLKHARAIVGNSSAGIREAPVYGVPSINIGTRQRNRFRSASIVDVLEDKEGLLRALRSIPGHFAPSMHFGHGKSAEAFRGVISGDMIWSIPCQKQFRDVNMFPRVKEK
jgi:UDP-N-acetylglucosamine 2-epimerase (hydrolysing)